MNRRWLPMIALVGLVAQFGAMGYMIVRRELALRNGLVCRFRTAPVDPYDAFRGRYVALNIAGAGSLICNREYARGQRIYAVVGEGTNGFSEIKRLTPRPEEDAVRIQTRVSYCQKDYRQLPAGTNDAARTWHEKHVPTGQYRVHFSLPFERFYMDEKLAPEAEMAYARGRQEGVLVVRVWHGLGVIEDLELGGRPIRDVARERLER